MLPVRLARVAAPDATGVQVAPLWLPLYHQAPLRLASVRVAPVWVMAVASRPRVLNVSLASLLPLPEQVAFFQASKVWGIFSPRLASATRVVPAVTEVQLPAGVGAVFL